MKKGIGDRMKFNYEQVWNIRLPHRMPTIVRLDGKAFHSFTRKMDKPFDNNFINKMAELTKFLCKEIHTTQMAYVQSDEISLLLHPYKKLDTEAWFRNELQKITSVSAGMASAWFSNSYKKIAVFDSRAFIVPESEAVNYFIWRQQDATRNSINSTAQSLHSHKQLLNKNTKEMQDMMMEKGVNWNNLETHKKRGFCVIPRWEVDWEIPKFTEDRNYIEKYLVLEEE